MPEEVAKVACYVVQDDHLLVFTHNNVPITVTGVQVPAGSIETDETPEEAAIRELFEETGRRGRVLRGLCSQRYDLRPARDEIGVRHYFKMSVMNADVTERWVAAETDPSHGGPNATWTCWWLPLIEAHVLAAGFGGLLGHMLEEDEAL